MTISRVKFPWPPFFRILIFFDEVFNSARGTTYLMRDDGATVVKVRPSRVICSLINPTDVLAQPRRGKGERRGAARSKMIDFSGKFPRK